jgi:trans-2,3-dihydro-3-hydroxyanthranilate isomerase
MSHRLLWVDAFTEKMLGGNPCAVVLDADDLNEATMQAIAREMNLSETAYVRRSSVADFGVRYFTPAEEIPLAGHPTIATTRALIDLGLVQKDSITLELKVGPIRVDIEWKDKIAGNIIMTQKKPQFLRTYPPDVLKVFQLSPDDRLADYPLQTVSTGTPQLMIPLRSAEALKKARVNIPEYEKLRASGDFFSVHLFCADGFTPQGQTSARHFGVPPDTMEDPFTGSATGGMAAYMWHYNLILKPSFIAEQGHLMGRPGSALVEVIGSREEIEAVKVGGKAVTVMQCEINL